VSETNRILTAVITAAVLWLPIAALPAFGETAGSWAEVSGIASDVWFQPLSRADGIPGDRIHQVLEDRRGFLWFSTFDGLVRFDGYEHRYYRGLPMVRTVEDQRPTLGSAYPGLLFEDRGGRLWVASDVLSRFDEATGSFNPVLKPRPGIGPSGSEEITAIHDGPGNSLWVAVSIYGSGEHGGKWQDLSEPVLYLVDPDKRTSEAHPISPNVTQGRPVSIRVIEQDPHGRLWLGTSIGLIRFDPANGSFLHYPHPPSSHNDPRKTFNSLIWDGTGHLWVHTPTGLERFDPATGVFDRFIQAFFWYATKDLTGKIWLWGGYPGLHLFDPASPPETALRSVSWTPSATAGADGMTVMTLGTDHHGNVWAYLYPLSTMYRYSPVASRFGAHIAQPERAGSLGGVTVRGFAEDSDGSIWIATALAGLDRFSSDAGTFTHFRHDPRRSQGLSSDQITSVYEDRSNAVWVAGKFGLGRLDSNSGRFTSFGDVINTGYSIYSMMEDTSGRFWIGDWAGSIHLLDRETGKASPEIARGHAIHEDREGNIWMGFPPGLNKLDRAGKLRTIPLPVADAPHPSWALEIRSIQGDASGMLWLGTTIGLYRFDPRSENATRFGVAQGMANEEVRCLVPDKDGSLWMSTAVGLSRFDPRDGRFQNFDERDGLQSADFTRRACYRAADGRLYFGGMMGFNAFYPNDVLAREPERPVTLTGMEINGMDAPVPAGGAMQLPHGRTVVLRFAALNPVNPARVHYRFQLAGLEKDWTEVDSSHRQARYTDLGPGDYVFAVTTALDGKSWGTSTASLRITIVPPWWRAWWAELLAGLALAGLLFSMHKIQVRVHHRRARRLSALIDQRTAELAEAGNRAQVASDEAQQARLQAEAANQAKSAFLAHMSHELRNPLSSILGISNLLREEDATEQQRQYLDMIDRSGEHLLDLINDVLDVAKIESGKQEIRLAPLDAIALAREVANIMRVKAEVKQVDLICSPSADIHPYVLADASKLRQILINLVGNAIKFTAKGHVTLRVGTIVAVGANRLTLRFEVEDTGIGIPPQEQARIFDPFVQVRQQIGQKGTGLGLTITRRFVEMMGGSIAVESTPGVGSRFVVEVPAELARPRDVKSPPPFGTGWFALQPGEPERRVLIVEDDPENAMILEQLLSRAGFPLRVAATGAAGLEFFTSWNPDFVWLDVQLPDMSGLEVARAIREMPGGRDVRIAAMTASAYESERAEALASGMDDFVRKPYRPAEIFDCMAHHLGVRFHRESSEATGKVNSA
jgi:signal transduction histidine kinase/ligand-binding sensor domain-containing protein/CheY-like chemotaxis protein